VPLSGQHPHRRRNALTGEWVLVSPQRAGRPWLGDTLPGASPAPPRFDPACYLCPGNLRASGERNPAYTGAFAFDNDFPALLPDSPAQPLGSTGLLTAEPERGICRVLCFSPRHDLTLGRMDPVAINGVIDAWCQESARLAEMPFLNSVQIFENRGDIMGASNPHPHCQIWANETLPNEIRKELDCQRRHFLQHHKCLLCNYLELDISGERFIAQNGAFAAVVPFWAVWPFEALVIGKRHAGSLQELTPRERFDLADIFKRLITRYDNLFEAPFPYTMGFHQNPCDGKAHEEWHLHAHFYPPLLRSAAVRKFMVGYEMLGMPQRDITPEAAAERLRASSEIHYLDRGGSRV
jgi:UDPglucose--hexose-1-phosphate uridylyltransferase